MLIRETNGIAAYERPIILDDHPIQDIFFGNTHKALRV